MLHFTLEPGFLFCDLCNGVSGSPLIHFQSGFKVERDRLVQIGLFQNEFENGYPDLHVRLEDEEVLQFVKETAGIKSYNKVRI